MLIHKIFHVLHSSELVSSQYDFDREFLRRPTGHYAYLKSVGTQASIDTLLRLYFEIEERVSDDEVANDDCQVLDDLAGELWEELQESAAAF